MTDDSAEILFQSFLRAIVSSSGIDRNVHSLTWSIRQFLCQPRRCPASWCPERWCKYSLPLNLDTKVFLPVRLRHTNILGCFCKQERRLSAENNKGTLLFASGEVIMVELFDVVENPKENQSFDDLKKRKRCVCMCVCERAGVCVSTCMCVRPSVCVLCEVIVYL